MKQKSNLPKKTTAKEAIAPATAQVPPLGWNFHERNDRKKGVVSEWIAEGKWSVKTRANFDRTIDQLKHQPRRSWSKPNPASKIGNHTYVIRFNDVSSKQLRLFGHFFDEHGSFVMTMGGYEKDDVYYPKNYESVAEAHRVQCDKDFLNSTRSFEESCTICNAKDVDAD